MEILDLINPTLWANSDIPNKTAKEADEVSDTYDTIDWSSRNQVLKITKEQNG